MQIQHGLRIFPEVSDGALARLSDDDYSDSTLQLKVYQLLQRVFKSLLTETVHRVICE